MHSRRSYTQSRFNYEHSWVYAMQIILVSFVVGVKNGSFALGMATFAVFMVLSMIRLTAMLLALGFSSLWAIVGYTTMAHYGGVGASIAAASFMFCMGFGFNASGIAFIRDMSRPA